MLLYAQQKTEGTPEEAAAGLRRYGEERGTPQKKRWQGAMDIIAEMIADDPDLTEGRPGKFRPMPDGTQIAAEAVDPEGEDRRTTCTTAADRSHQPRCQIIGVLAVNRGRKGRRS